MKENVSASNHTSCVTVLMALDFGRNAENSEGT